MDLETNRRIRVIRNRRYTNYIFNKLKSIRNNDNTDNITPDEEKQIINLIENDFKIEKENIINTILEKKYNNKKFKIFINKDKYLNNNREKHTYIIDNIKNHFKRINNINNDYSLYYCKSYTYMFIDRYKNKKNIYCTLRYLIIKLAMLEEKYSNRLKKLYSLTNNYKELKNIIDYENIDRYFKLNQQNMITNTINNMSKNIKTLKYNIDKRIDNGFFGL